MDIRTFRDLKTIIAQDAFRYDGGGTLFSRFKLYRNVIGFRYTFWLRVCRYLYRKSLLLPLWYLSFRYLRHLSYKSGIQIPFLTHIGRGFYIGHFGTIIINRKAIIGNNVNVSPGVIIGQTNRGVRKGVPIIGNEVYIGPDSKIIGNIRVGNNVAIGANAVVTKDVIDNACVAGIPARIINMEGSKDYVGRIV